MEGLARRIVLTGSESTGKTTLTADLARRYYGACPDWIRVADPQRDRPGDRPAMHQLFRSALVSLGFPFEVIRGGWRERFLAARSAIEELEAKSPCHRSRSSRPSSPAI